ncbi:MAG TPA: proton-conducting transporter membrane subunit [Elusimicrobiota bacterium]|nr:proton-conducting transporter membrane subunit [Elusimicrobiota bacterium]
MIPALLLIPTLAALLAFVLPSVRGRRVTLVSSALAHLVITGLCWIRRPVPALSGWLSLDPAGLLFLSIASLLFTTAAIYTVGSLRDESPERIPSSREDDFFFSPESENVFIGCLLLFLAAMTAVTLCQHFGLLWVAVEATTLASAPLIYFHRSPRSLEATWKYLMICSVGIALALVGNYCLTAALAIDGGADVSMTVSELMRQGTSFNKLWLKASFLFFLVGYGTKMGLAPLHTWLPDAHSEAPSAVSSLLSGALLNCAFLSLYRIHQVCDAAGLGLFTQDLFRLFGILSMGVATLFLLSQSDYKRMLAYSSVEHMGILSLGMGLGPLGLFGALWHSLNHSLSKSFLFLTAGNLLTFYKTKSTRQIRGILKKFPITGILWMAGFFAITGTPPFGTFFSEFTILKAILEQGRIGLTFLYLGFLALAFIGMSRIFLNMSQGEPDETVPSANARKEPWIRVLPPLILAGLSLLLGFYLPEGLMRVLQEASRYIPG